MEGALPGGREAEDEPRSCLVLDRQTGHGQSVAVSPGAAGARKVCKVYGGGAGGRRLDGGEILRMWATNLGEQFLRTDSSAGELGLWLGAAGCVVVWLLRVLWSSMGAGQEELGVMFRRPYVRAPMSVDARNWLVKTEEIRSRNQWQV